MKSRSPGLACVIGKHLMFYANDDTHRTVAGWCVWCGTGSSDPERFTLTGDPLGFEPTYEVVIPEGWHRLPADA